MPARISDDQRAAHFWSKVDKGNECWEWMGYRDRDGYGRYWRKENGKGQSSLAHRRAWELTHGAIPVEMEIDHLCRVRNCVNPSHLEPVTRAENQKRAMPQILSALSKHRNHGKKETIKSCPHGHPYSGDNLYVAPRPGRTARGCRACIRAATYRYKQKQRAQGRQ